MAQNTSALVKRVSQSLLNMYSETEVMSDVNIEGRQHADLIIEREVGTDIAVKIIDDYDHPAEVAEKTLPLKIGRYQVIAVAPVDMNKGMEQGTTDYDLCRYCASSGVGLMDIDDPNGFVITPRE